MSTELFEYILIGYARKYALTTQFRATDLIRRVPDFLSPGNLLSQTIAEHNFMTASLLELILLYYNDRLKAHGFIVPDPIYASFMAFHHDDDEWEFGDLVPSLGYGCLSQADKDKISASSIRKLYGVESNFVLKAYDEYEQRQTPTAQLVKVCDILELFGHNRILLSHGLGLITEDNYQSCLPEARIESEQFLTTFGHATSIAEVLEHIYVKRYGSLGFPWALNFLFYELLSAMKSFDFKTHVPLPLE